MRVFHEIKVVQTGISQNFPARLARPPMPRHVRVTSLDVDPLLLRFCDCRWFRVSIRFVKRAEIIPFPCLAFENNTRTDMNMPVTKIMSVPGRHKYLSVFDKSDPNRIDAITRLFITSLIRRLHKRMLAWNEFKRATCREIRILDCIGHRGLHKNYATSTTERASNPFDRSSGSSKYIFAAPPA